MIGCNLNNSIVADSVQLLQPDVVTTMFSGRLSSNIPKNSWYSHVDPLFLNFYPAYTI